MILWLLQCDYEVHICGFERNLSLITANGWNPADESGAPFGLNYLCNQSNSLKKKNSPEPFFPVLSLLKVLNQLWGWTEEIHVHHEWRRLVEGDDIRKDGQKSWHTCFIFWGRRLDWAWGGDGRGLVFPLAYGSCFFFFFLFFFFPITLNNQNNINCISAICWLPGIFFWKMFYFPYTRHVTTINLFRRSFACVTLYVSPPSSLPIARSFIV